MVVEIDGGCCALAPYRQERCGRAGFLDYIKKYLKAFMIAGKRNCPRIVEYAKENFSKGGARAWKLNFTSHLVCRSQGIRT